jgi:hypothetical protein
MVRFFKVGDESVTEPIRPPRRDGLADCGPSAGVIVWGEIDRRGERFAV